MAQGCSAARRRLKENENLMSAVLLEWTLARFGPARKAEGAKVIAFTEQEAIDKARMLRAAPGSDASTRFSPSDTFEVVRVRPVMDEREGA